MVPAQSCPWMASTAGLKGEDFGVDFDDCNSFFGTRDRDIMVNHGCSGPLNGESHLVAGRSSDVHDEKPPTLSSQVCNAAV